ncbi:MAG: signal peptidase I [Isosphaeraceae bacterium]
MGRTASPAQAEASPRKSVKHNEPPATEGHRDTVEAIVVAFILALVVRGFEAQAFVIPTGSMAPTLMGRHKEVTCEQCGFVFTVNASHEVEGTNPAPVYSGLCTNCRYQANKLTDEPSFKGDRILVMMFPYDLPFLPGASPPERFDVVVFRYPEEPEVSYIKRLIGLPGETIRVKHGDIYVKPKDGQDFRLERKPLKHQLAMQMIVHDDRHRPKAMAGDDRWLRWRSQSPDGWKMPNPNRSLYQCQAESGENWVELDYQNLVPDPEQWSDVLDGIPLRHPPRSSLITDFYSYNTNMTQAYSDLLGEPAMAHYAWMQPHWVGDLTLEANLEVTSKTGEVRFELIKGGVAQRCSINVASGIARFTRGDETLREHATPIKGPGRYQIVFANVDDRITLLVDGQPMGGDGVEYDRGETPLVPTQDDLMPVRIAARGASVSVSDLVLKRDIYYTQTPGEIDYGAVFGRDNPRSPTELLNYLADPSHFSNFSEIDVHEYKLGDDRYMMLGDNSPQSKDSRGWDNADKDWDEASHRQTWEVPRKLLTGKAFYVYWPHGVPFWPELLRIGNDTRLPFRPYVERMRWIR